MDGSTKPYVFGAVGLGVGVLLGLMLAPPGAAPPANPALVGLDANLYVQTAAEYAACCRQTYRLAGEKLAQRLKDRAGKGGNPNKRPAVVLDLDETVLDNSPYQTYLLQNGLTFTRESWDRWEKDYPDEVMLVPGASEFLQAAQAAGVVPVYISNRLAKFKGSTVKVLKHLNIDTADIDARLLLADSLADSNKEPRRAKARERYDVLMYIGDNLRDLSEIFVAPKDLKLGDPEALRAAIRERRARVKGHEEKFGDEWFLLPNPVYGEWTKYIGKQPLQELNPTPMRAR